MSEIHETLEDVDLAPTCLVKSLGRVRLFATPWTVAHQAPPSMEFSRQEYWSGLPFPSPGDLPDPGIEPGSPTLRADALPSEPPGNPPTCLILCKTLHCRGFLMRRWQECEDSRSNVWRSSCLPSKRKLERSPGTLSVVLTLVGGVTIKGIVLRTRLTWVTLGKVDKLAQAPFPPLQTSFGQSSRWWGGSMLLFSPSKHNHDTFVFEVSQVGRVKNHMGYLLWNLSYSHRNLRTSSHKTCMSLVNKWGWALLFQKG